MTTFIHRLSGQTFIADEGAGSYGPTSRDGHWSNGQAGTIWPSEPLFGQSAWVAA